MSNSTFIPICHPDRKPAARGLCRRCYNKAFYLEHRDRLIPKARERAKKWKAENIDRYIEYKIRYNNKKVGITAKDYEQILIKQKGMCAICQKEPPYCRDHSHITGKFRGLLCRTCNLGIGYFKDNKDFLQKAIIYLDENSV